MNGCQVRDCPNHAEEFYEMDHFNIRVCAKHGSEWRKRNCVITGYFRDMTALALAKAARGYIKDGRTLQELKRNLSDEMRGELLDLLVYQAYGQ